MKTQLYKKITIMCAALCLLAFGAQNSRAQVTIHEETFNAAFPNWPAGWSASTGNNPWVMDTSTANASYVPTSGKYGYPGASGGAMVEESNPSNGDTGTFTVTSCIISTTGYKNITAIFGSRLTKHFADSGSSIKSFAWTNNGGNTWNTISFTQNPNDSYWHLANDSVPMALSAGANNQDSIRFRWTAFIHSNAGSGTFRFDDLVVAGDISTGVNQVNDNSSICVFPNPASNFVTLYNNNTGKNLTVRIFDVTGKVVKTVLIAGDHGTINVSDIDAGFCYFAQINATDNNEQLQVVKFAVAR